MTASVCWRASSDWGGQACLQVTESLLLLAPEDMVGQQGAGLGRVLVAVVGDAATATSNVRDEGLLMALEVAETLVTVHPAGGAALLEQTGLAGKLVKMALGGAESSRVTAQLLCVLSRTCAAAAAAFLGMLARVLGGAAAAAAAACGSVDACAARVDQLMCARSAACSATGTSTCTSTCSSRRTSTCTSLCSSRRSL